MLPPASTQPGREEIEKWLRDALNHLYDIGYLENHPLADLLLRPEEMTGKRGADLRKVLISAIQARKPPRGVPQQSPDGRGYQILEQHVLAGLNPAEVAQKLNISRSLFFLEKTRILKVVFDDLWNNRIAASMQPPDEDRNTAPPPGITEAEQLLQGAVFEALEIRSLLDSLRPLIEPLASVNHTSLDFQADGEAVIPHGDRVLLRQVLLSLVNEQLHRAAGGKLKIAAFDQPGAFGVRIELRQPQTDAKEQRLEERRGLEMATAQEIVRAMDGRLSVEQPARGVYRAALTWFHSKQARQMLLIDDHPDIADLITRLLDRSGWEILWAASAENARRILATTRPEVILLDVILPLEDGWEFLITLKGDPLTREIPVVVCSAINEPDLVRSLGAQGYLPKPFTAAQLIQALRLSGG